MVAVVVGTSGILKGRNKKISACNGLVANPAIGKKVMPTSIPKKQIEPAEINLLKLYIVESLKFLMCESFAQDAEKTMIDF